MGPIIMSLIMRIIFAVVAVALVTEISAATSDLPDTETILFETADPAQREDQDVFRCPHSLRGRKVTRTGCQRALWSSSAARAQERRRLKGRAKNTHRRHLQFRV